MRAFSSDDQNVLKNVQDNQKTEHENDPYDIEWDRFTVDDESYWDHIFGKNFNWVKTNYSSSCLSQYTTRNERKPL